MLTLLQRHAPALLAARPAAARRLSSAAVPAALVKQLRELTAAPMMDCRNALAAEGNDVAKAVDWLRKKGMAAASKKAGRAAAQGVVACATSVAGDAGVLVEVNSETDFVARNEQFQALVARIARVALDSLPPPAAAAAAAAAGAVAPTGCAAVDGADFAAWRERAPLPGGDALGAPCSVGAGVVDLVGRIRENLVARRGARLAQPGGLVVGYTHNAVAPGMGTIGVLVALAPTDPATPPLAPGATPGYAALADAARKVAMHVAAAQPSYVSRASVPPAALAREREILATQAAGSGKPPAIAAKMVEGRLTKFYADCVLVEQPFILAADEGVRVAAWLDAAAKAAGAPRVHVAAFAHLVLGEGVGAAPGEAAEAA